MYKIKIDNFEGPFDLLLYFIKRDELDIYDIPISLIAEEFLEYIRFMQQLDIDQAGDFIVMSATLMQIKSQMLLPRDLDEDGEPIEDPRTELVQKLLEYQQIKESVEKLSDNLKRTEYTYYRENFDYENEISKNSIDGVTPSIYDLINAFNNLVKRNKSNNYQHKVDANIYTIEDQSNIILNKLKQSSKLSFSKLFAKVDRLQIVTAFLAILDLVRKNEVFIYQEENYSEISLTSIQP
ncbi:segregation/condensation protein A [Candidatus Kapabacteria bacterium]|nr:segregation/condensation protein A [Candidatus Kapabacteria bacterium]